ncbi:MAG: hypothetical protein CM15mP3_04960 [Candidatus Poseidoniales archaeon]|nr:MAG: hypothetical protein CM15mP3_04960 [Candidatus Poseidoniales archaeon]
MHPLCPRGLRIQKAALKPSPRVDLGGRQKGQNVDRALAMHLSARLEMTALLSQSMRWPLHRVPGPFLALQPRTPSPPVNIGSSCSLHCQAQSLKQSSKFRLPLLSQPTQQSIYPFEAPPSHEIHRETPSTRQLSAAHHVCLTCPSKSKFNRRVHGDKVIMLRITPTFVGVIAGLKQRRVHPRGFINHACPLRFQ